MGPERLHGLSAGYHPQLTLDSSGRNAADPAFDADHIVQYGYNAALDGQAMFIPYLGSAGATLQDESGHFTFASPEGEAAVGYLVNLINKEHVAPLGGRYER